MNDDLKKNENKNKSIEFGTEVGKKVNRKMKARKNPIQVWFGLGMMGLIGWSVIIPTLLGTAIGIALDKYYPGGRSWTLVLLVAGLCLGCLNAWHWVNRQYFEMHEKTPDGKQDKENDNE